jgi:D-alanyl-D-alanine carboxypeptidase (penicillin-binding protein 5/6)
MKKFVRFLLCVGAVALEAKPLSVDVKAKSAILINAKNGLILFEKNAHSQAFPASTTKIATALYILDNHKDLNKLARVSKEAITCVSAKEKSKSNYTCPAYWLEPTGTSFDLKRGELIPIKALLYGAMLCSGNDAANVLAENTEGSINNFIEKLNIYVKSLGCEHTHFCNPHGLHHPRHVTTAYDMALIAQKAMQNPLFRQIVKSTSAQRPKTNLQKAKSIRQFNGLLLKSKANYYPYAIGVKTGYHSQAKNTLVAAAEKDSRMLIAVIFGCETSEERYQDAKKLFKAAFTEPKVKKLVLNKDEATLTHKVKGGKTTLEAYLEENVEVNIYASEEKPIKAFVHWDEKFTLPINTNQRVGEIWVETIDGDILLKQPIFAKKPVYPTFLFKKFSM